MTWSPQDRGQATRRHYVHSNLKLAGFVAAGALLAAGLSSLAFSASRDAGASPARATSTTTTILSAAAVS